MSVQILQGDCRDVLKTIDSQSVSMCVTSPPYFGLRDYGCDGQIGLEQTPEAYVAELVGVFREVRRVLRDDGTLWLNLGDSYARSGAGNNGNEGYCDGRTDRQSRLGGKGYAGLKPKDLIGIPWRVAFALQADGWYLRQDIIWHKPNPMPESVTDRCTKAHEYIFLLSKSAKYHCDMDAIKEKATEGTDLGLLRGRKDVGKTDGVAWHAPSIAKRQDEGIDSTTAGDGTRNKRSVWTVTTKPYKEAHFATFPPDLIRPCILAGCPVGGTVLDCFGGSGTTGEVSEEEGRNSILLELNPEYVDMSKCRTAQMGLFCNERTTS